MTGATGRQSMRSSDRDSVISSPLVTPLSNLTLFGRSRRAYCPPIFSGNSTPFRMLSAPVIPMNSRDVKSVERASPSRQPRSVSMANMT